MVSYTALDLNKQVGIYNDKLNLNLDGKKISDCISIIQDKCPQLHSTEEIREYCKDHLKNIPDTFGYKALRIFYYSFIKQDLLKSYTGEDMLENKYSKLIRDIKEYHNNLVDWINLKLDYYVYCTELEKVYKEEYGIITDYNNYLYSILKTINISYYDEEVINSLLGLLKRTLLFCGDKYYSNQDLTNNEILDMLYEHISEEAFDESQYTGLNVFYSYDGYGNEYFIDDYSISWHDEDGYHCKFTEKESTLEDYVRRG